MNSDRTDQETGTSATDAVELTSWKEIAHYLGVHVRTAQKWVHTLRLPVHRRAGARSRVFAYTAELDAWKRQGLRASPQERHYSWPLGSGSLLRFASRVLRWSAGTLNSCALT